MIENRKYLINGYVKALRENRASVFLGAGMSMSVCNCDWKGIVAPIVVEAGMKLKDDDDLMVMAQYAVTNLSKKKGTDYSVIFKNLIAGQFSTKETTRASTLFAKLPIKNYWTTNYDHVIEKALEDNKSSFFVMRNNDDYSKTEGNRDKIVYKMHGDYVDPPNIVILTDDYRYYNKKNPNFITALENDVASNSILFLGYSFRDEDVNCVLNNVSVKNMKMNEHYFIQETADADNRTLQSCWIEEKKKFGINTLLVDDNKVINNIIEEVYKQYMGNKVFISASASEYSQYGTKEDVKYLIKEVAYGLVERTFNHEMQIIHGEGLGISQNIKEGLIKASQDFGLDIARLQVTYPFSEDYYSLFNKPIDIEEQYRIYRNQMIDKCGVAIFMFGNKLDKNGNVINADGVCKEFNIAHEQGKYVFPIGVTGYMAEELSKLVLADFAKYNGDSVELKYQYTKLCDKSLGVDEIVQTLSEMINFIAFSSD